MKIIHTADWHLGKSLNDFSLLEDQKYYLNNLFDLLKKENADALIIAGDIYDRSVPSAEAISLFDDFLIKVTSQLKTKIFAVSGNHDSAKRIGFANKLFRHSGLFIESIYNKKIQKFQCEDQFGVVNFYLLPYISTAEVKSMFEDDNFEIKTANDALKKIISNENIDYSQRNILITHGFFGFSSETDQKIENDCLLSDSETRVGTIDICDGKILEHFDYVALGHIHSPQKVGKEYIRYSGSLLKYSISEYNQKKNVCQIDIFEKGNIKISQNKIDTLRDLRILRGEFSSFFNVTNHEYKDDYLFFELTDKNVIIDPMNKLRSLYNNVLGLKFIKKEIEFVNKLSTDVIKSKSDNEHFEDFYLAVTGDKINETQKQVIVDIL